MRWKKIVACGLLLLTTACTPFSLNSPPNRVTVGPTSYSQRLTVSPYFTPTPSPPPIVGLYPGGGGVLSNGILYEYDPRKNDLIFYYQGPDGEIHKAFHNPSCSPFGFRDYSTPNSVNISIECLGGKSYYFLFIPISNFRVQ